MLNEIIKNRYSTRAFSDKKIDKEILTSLFEAARWSPSSMNEQPWRFIVAEKEDEISYKKMLSLLYDKNREWASNAPILILTITNLKHERNNKMNKFALYDAGQSVAYLTMQASHLGLYLRQMGGFDSEKAKELFEIPDDFIPLTVIAIGYKGEVNDLPLILRERENAVRNRMPLEKIVFSEKFNSQINYLKENSTLN